MQKIDYFFLENSLKMLPQIIIVIVIFSLFTIIGYENIAILCFTLGLYSVIRRRPIQEANFTPVQNYTNNAIANTEIDNNSWESY